MFERFKRNIIRRAYDERRLPRVATTRTARDTTATRVATPRTTAAVSMTADGRHAAPASRETVRDMRARQRAEYGGLNWGAAFFGWLVAVGMAAILLGLLSAAGTAFGLTDVSESEANANADTIGLVGGILLVAVLAIAYSCGGYVSGRMSRFDGARQGFGTLGHRPERDASCSPLPARSSAPSTTCSTQLEPAAHPDRRGHAHDRRGAIALAAVAGPVAAGRDGRRQGRRALPPQDRPLA